jgi:glutamine amidotransferase
MCLLTFIPSGVDVDSEDLRNGAIYNDDGFGFAVHMGDSIITGKGMNFEEVLERFTEVRSRFKGHAIFHSRITTHGVTDTTNCHPFKVGTDDLTVVGHNGILPIKPVAGDKRSDTNIFASEYLPSLGGVYALDDLTVRKSLENWAKGSKLVVLTADRHANSEYYILNEADGHWSDGVWWSNYSYCYTPAPAKSSYGYSSSYGYGSWTGNTYTTRTPIERDTYMLDDDEDWYGDMYEVECPFCGTNEVYDLVNEDVHECHTCGSCMWCGWLVKDCHCWDNDDDQNYEPFYRKMTEDEVIQWCNNTFVPTPPNYGSFKFSDTSNEEQYDAYQV